MALAASSSMLSWRVRSRWLAASVSVALVSALLASVPVPASAADPGLPPGASRVAPGLQTGDGQPLPPSTSTDQSQGGRGQGATPDETHPQPKLGPPKVSDWHPTSDRPAEAAGAGAAGMGFQAGRSVEDVSARSPHSTEFTNPDGSRTRRVYQEIAFVPDAAGRMRSLDTSLKASAVDGRLVPGATLARTSFAASASAADLARLDLGDGVSLGFGVEAAAGVSGSVDGRQVTYQNARPGSDVRMSATTFGMKTELLLRSAAAPTTWEFPLRTLGATPTWDEASKSVKLSDRRGNLVALIPPGFMYDASFDERTGGPRTSTGVRYTLLPRGPVGRCGWTWMRRGWPIRLGCGR